MSILDEMFQNANEQKRAEAAAEKIKPLFEHIFEECKRQNYTVYELEKLILAMTVALEADKQKIFNRKQRRRRYHEK